MKTRRKPDLSGYSEEELKEYYKSRVLNYLSRRKTAKEVRIYLSGLQCPERIVQELLEFTDEYRFTDDEEYARCFIRDSSRIKHHSRKRIRYDLQQKGLERELIERVLEEVNPSDEAAAAWHMRKRLKNEEDEEERQKCCNYLYSHGFSYDVIERVLKERE